MRLRQSLAGAGPVMQLSVGPMMPEDLVRRTSDQRLAVLPGQIDRFRLRRLQFVRAAAAVVLEFAAVGEAKCAGKFIGFARQF